MIWLKNHNCVREQFLKSLNSQVAFVPKNSQKYDEVNTYRSDTSVCFVDELQHVVLRFEIIPPANFPPY